MHRRMRHLVREGKNFDQFDAQLFSMYLFKFSTCFEQPRAHHQENQLYQYNLWYMSLCVGDLFVCVSDLHTK